MLSHKERLYYFSLYTFLCYLSVSVLHLVCGLTEREKDDVAILIWLLLLVLLPFLLFVLFMIINITIIIVIIVIIIIISIIIIVIIIITKTILGCSQC